MYSRGFFKKKIRIWLITRAAKRNNADAIYALAGCYADGELVDESEEKAVDCLFQIARNDDMRGCKTLEEYCLSNATNKVFWQNHPKLFDWVKSSAESGKANSQYILGVYYRYIKQDLIPAMRYCCLAQEQGHLKARDALLQMLSNLDAASLVTLFQYATNGDNTCVCILYLYLDQNKSSIQHTLEIIKGLLEWIMVKANAGNANFEYLLGIYYQYVEHNIEKSVEFYAKAYRKRHSGAAEALGKLYCQIAEMYQNGAGVKRDLDQAMTYYQESHRYGCDLASVGVYSIGLMYLYGTDAVPRDINRAVKTIYIALEWKCPSIDYFDIYTAGLCYFNADGVSEDVNKAVNLFTIAADNNIGEAQCILGKCYLEGIGVVIDRKKAVSYLEKANQSSEAMYLLAKCLENGWGVKTNIVKSMKQYTTAADLGSLNAAFRVSEMYFKGLYDRIIRCDDYSATEYGETRIGEDRLHKYIKVAPDHDIGLKYLSMAALGGIAEAQFELARCYMDGRYVPRDIATALYWYKTAAVSGSIAAQEVLDNWNDSNTSK